MFFTNDVSVFSVILWTSKFNVSARIRTQHFDSRFVYIWKVVHSQKTKLPVAITSFWKIVLFVRSGTGEQRFPGLWFSCVLLQLLPILSVDLLDSRLLILCQLRCHVHVFGIQSGERSDVGRHRLNRALESLFTLTLFVFKPKQGVWLNEYNS